MSRSLKKGPFVSSYLINRVNEMQSSERREGSDKKKLKKNIIKTCSRASVILPSMVGYTFAVYNGRTHVPVFCSEQMIGCKLGEFSPTRKFRSRGRKDRKLKVKK